MGPATSMHMLFGAVLGWAILSPLAKHKGWAPGPVGDWEVGSKGWIIWVSLAIMLADSIINLGWLIVRTAYESYPRLASKLKSVRRNGSQRPDTPLHSDVRYSTLGLDSDTAAIHEEEGDLNDAPPTELISNRTVAVLLPLALVLNVVCMHIAFGDIITPFLSTLATLLAVLLSIMGVRALGETDLNPVSGISKLTQLIFSLATPSSMHTRRSAIVTNLLAGAVSEAGALQAGDMMQDLKTGHLLGASPKAQFYGQVIGSLFGAVVSTAVYKMYASVYPVPGDQFQIPTAFVWIFTARLVTGQGLPPMAWQAAVIFGAIFVATTALKIMSTYRKPFGYSPSPWVSFVPGGIAVAVGMFNVPSFTLARAIGGVIAWWWARRSRNAYKNTAVSVVGLDQPSTAVEPSPAGDDDEAEEEEEEEEEDNEREGAEDHPLIIQQQQPPLPSAAEVEDESSSTVVVLASGLILGEGVLSILNLILASMGVPHL
jgi:OPT family oligopeptide transporter